MVDVPVGAGNDPPASAEIEDIPSYFRRCAADGPPMRVFIAIELPEDILKVLAHEQARFRAVCPEARWTRPDGFHLTLKFLGEIPNAKSLEVIQSLERIGSFESLSVEVGGFGCFPSARRPRVLWVGVNASPALVKLAADLEAAMEAIGLPRESRSFTPHLTLARFKTQKPQPNLEALLRESGKATLGSFEVTEYYLWESRLSPEGSVYRKIARFPGRPEHSSTD